MFRKRRSQSTPLQHTTTPSPISNATPTTSLSNATASKPLHDASTTASLDCYVTSHSGGRNAGPLPTEEGLCDFAFAQVEPDRKQLVRDKHGEDCPIWELRALLQANPASEGFTRDAAQIIGRHLDADARLRLEPAWVSIQRDARRDAMVEKILQEGWVRHLWDRIDMALAGGIVGRVQALLGTTAVALPRKTRAREQSMETAVAAFLTRFRTRLRCQLGCSRDDDGWGACFGHGNRHIVDAEPDDIKERTGDDMDLERSYITIFCRRPRRQGGKPVQWADIVSIIEVKTSQADDLSAGLAQQVIRDARSIKKARPLCSTVHVVTMCGPIVRLWVFGPGAFTTSAGYIFGNADHELAIASIFAFLVAAKPNQLIGQWSPPSSFVINNGNEAQTWTWTEGPKVLFVGDDMFGSQTVLFGGTANPSDAGVDKDSQEAQRTGDITFVKCLFLPPHLVGHESHMQEIVKDVRGAPKPLGVIHSSEQHMPPSQQALSWTERGYPVAPLAQGDGPFEDLRLHAFAFQHRRGQPVPLALSETGSVRRFAQLIKQLLGFAERDAHYRDLNLGNYLLEYVEKQPRLLLVNHENMRLALQERGVRVEHTVGADLFTGAQSRLKLLYSLARDDVRCADPLFLPCSAHFLDVAVKKVRTDNFILTEVEEDDSDPTLDMRLYAHSYLDALESACYLQVRMAALRSFDAEDWSLKELDKRLRDQHAKLMVWRADSSWKSFLKLFCPAMTSEWTDMMVELRKTIVQAQRDRRKNLRELLGRNAATLPMLDEERKLQSVDRLCFQACLAILRRCEDRVRSSEFTTTDRRPKVDDEWMWKMQNSAADTL